MSKVSEISEQIKNCLAKIQPANGYTTDIKNIYIDAETVPDRAGFPCALVNVDSDSCAELLGVQANRERVYSIEIVFKRGATQADLDAAHIDVLRALGFGKYQYERELKGLLTDQQSASFEFGAQGTNYTTVTITIVVMYVENYA